MSLFVERKEIRMTTTKNEKKYTDCPENDVHQQQDFIPKGFDFFLCSETILNYLSLIIKVKDRTVRSTFFLKNTRNLIKFKD